MSLDFVVNRESSWSNSGRRFQQFEIASSGQWEHGTITTKEIKLAQTNYRYHLE